ncbi:MULTISPECIES: DUF4224 domain-containing protein [unclassified Caballeronia]|uniref:DUF4224 domain-containing protein n=1 Tax=unclassified Caballeronia TaxID=2646786 RepID=UPI00285A1BBA|nr:MULTISPECIES: DUF4224 domain-containing protein [unclassified Caballeronia]MDR5777373.1 DUF4224 domain-containing protein [Caballeronia sp. LZ002]MDR5802544.1 DUF4224 domain-containing protein [Caballeronia sp. LZ001]MDR5852811.1 DUF4224 domain-containing protein [Caballeronia sp. LZ003]
MPKVDRSNPNWLAEWVAKGMDERSEAIAKRAAKYATKPQLKGFPRYVPLKIWAEIMFGDHAPHMTTSANGWKTGTSTLLLRRSVADSSLVQTPITWSEKTMGDRLLTHADLAEVTGLLQRNKQADWFAENFAINVVRRNDGLVVMTWDTFELLLARKYRLDSGPIAELRPPLRPLFPKRS